MTDIDLGLNMYQYNGLAHGKPPEMGHTISNGNDSSRVWIDPEQPGGSVDIGDISHWQSSQPIWLWGGMDSDRSNPVPNPHQGSPFPTPWQATKQPWGIDPTTDPTINQPFELDSDVLRELLGTALKREAEVLEVDDLGDVERRVDHLEI